MSGDLEAELLRVAHVLCVKRQGLREGVTASELREFIEQAPLDKTFRLGHRLLSHLIEGLLEMLAAARLLERIDAMTYALTPEARAYVAREPAYLSADDWAIAGTALAPDRKDRAT
ncbi:MAG TPA: hypothetical protein VFV99_04860 [Kofleriaceae bacterium]|nr:hypothetical protein [Kofleriaceae bacterium]